MNAINKIHLECDVIEGSVENGTRKHMIFTFILDKSSGYKTFASQKQYTLKKSLICFEYKNFLFTSW